MSSTNKNLDYDSLFKEIDRYNELPVSNESFSEYLTRIKYHNQISNKKLADRTGLSEATVCRYLTGSAKRMTNANILALVMGFELTSTQIEAALRLSGVRIDNPNKLENRIIQFCLDQCSLSGEEKMTVSDCNRLLAEKGLPPLTQKGVDGIPD